MSHSPLKSLKYENKVFEDFVAYLTTCILRYALANVFDSFRPHHVYEFYYISASDDVEVIIGTINDGNFMLSIIVCDIRRTLPLPICDEYFRLPILHECRGIQVDLGYDFMKEKNYNVYIFIFPLLGKLSLEFLANVSLTKL